MVVVVVVVVVDFFLLRLLCCFLFFSSGHFVCWNPIGYHFPESHAAFTESETAMSTREMRQTLLFSIT